MNSLGRQSTLIQCLLGHEKGRVTALPVHSLHSDSAMNPTTVDLLREAAIQALRNKQDASAHELLTLIKVAPPPQLKALPSESQASLVNGIDHDSTFWAGYIRQNFFPFMAENGRTTFSSIELNAWLSIRSDIEFTDSDTQVDSENKPQWRKRVSKSLARLKSQGLLKAKDHGKTYEILEHHQALLP